MTNLTPDQQYLNLCKKVLKEGIWIDNKRTGKKVLTAINADLEYDCRDNTLPIITTKKTYYKSAMAEMLGYLRGYTSAAQFRALGTNTWNANANAESWQKSPYCKGKDDMGYCYGAVGRECITPEGLKYDQLAKVYTNLKQGIDDRREILTFWHPGSEHLACLPACMHTHTFSVLDGTLYLTSYQRSCDIPLGLPFNMIQVAWLLMVMAQITGLKPGIAYHKIVNAHIYKDQIKGIKEQLKNKPFTHPKLVIGSCINNLSDLMNEDVGINNFYISEYESHKAIIFPFSV